MKIANRIVALLLSSCLIADPALAIPFHEIGFLGGIRAIAPFCVPLEAQALAIQSELIGRDHPYAVDQSASKVLLPASVNLTDFARARQFAKKLSEVYPLFTARHWDNKLVGVLFTLIGQNTDEANLVRLSKIERQILGVSFEQLHFYHRFLLDHDIHQWLTEVNSQFADFLKSPVRIHDPHGDLLFNENDDAVILTGNNYAGKTSLGYTLVQRADKKFKAGAEDTVLVLETAGFLFAGPIYHATTWRPRAIDMVERRAVQPHMQMGLVRSIVNLTRKKDLTHPYKITERLLTDYQDLPWSYTGLFEGPIPLQAIQYLVVEHQLTTEPECKQLADDVTRRQSARPAAPAKKQTAAERAA